MNDPVIEEIKNILKELTISRAESEKEMAEIKAMFKETDAKFKETDAKFKETDAKFKELGKKIGDLGDKFGYFTEGMALPTMEKILEEKFQIDTIMPRFTKKLRGGNFLEYDVFGYCNGDVNNAVIVEIKSKLRYDDIQELTNKLYDFKNIFPEFSDKHLYGILAAVDVPNKNLIDKVEEAGLYFARISEDIFTMNDNPKARDFNK
ncbi:MAG: DUF3782 domain-containing protein [Cytophagaceae bacterium]|nr:DUF3782 domain-containing protein [Cytophagaceae bacterium]MDW8456788.1 DUF3782 domain-containing protein [Cytophagaceae bacterium]